MTGIITWIHLIISIKCIGKKRIKNIKIASNSSNHFFLLALGSPLVSIACAAGGTDRPGI